MLSFLGGVFFESFFHFGLFEFLFLLAFLFIYHISFKKTPNIFEAVFLLTFFLGSFLYQNYAPDNSYLNNEVGKNINIKGVISQEPNFKISTQSIILKTDGGKISVSTARFPEYEYGDKISVSGILEKPENFEDFDYINYLAKDKIYFILNKAHAELLEKGKGNKVIASLFYIKKSFEDNLRALLPSPESDFINGILFGSKSEMSQDLYQKFITTGTAHIIALSGFNITIIVIFLAWIFGYIIKRKRLVVIIAIVTISLFVIMTGASSSVVRAAIMGSVLLLAKYYGRARHALNALLFAAFLMILLNPKVLAFDISFQLSFLATLGLLYIYPYILKKFEFLPEFFKLRDSASATIAAQIAVLPVLLQNFGQLSLISPVVNILILPLIPLAMLFGFLAGMFGFISLFLAKIFSIPLWIILWYQLKIIDICSGLPYASINF